MRLHCWLMWATLPVPLLGPHGSPKQLLGMLCEHAHTQALPAALPPSSWPTC